MILKPALKSSRDIDELERIAAEHPASAVKARQQIARIGLGNRGEENAAHFLDRLYRDSQRNALLHDVRLECAEGDFAQIDHLLINRVWATVWILETKNYSGNMKCNEHGDWTVYYGSKPVAIPSPVEQARRQAVAFERWLKVNNFSSIRKVIPVVLVNPRTQINRANLRPGEHIIKSDNFQRFIEEQMDQAGVLQVLSVAARFAASGMSEQKLRDLGSAICAADRPASFDWELRMGVKQQAGAKLPKQAQIAASVPAQEPLAVPTAKLASPEIASSLAARDNAMPVVPERIATPHGDITIKSIGTDYAIRNPPHADVIDVVRKACRGNGRWNGRFMNWLIPADNIALVTAELRKHFS